nr:EpsG family protein [uncultured Brumimicrobium sp.]
MLQSFFVYITLGLILYSLGYLAHVRQKNNLLLNKKTPFWTWEVALALLVFAFVAGVRWNVGVDHQHYLANYLNYQFGGEGIFDKEIGFEYITQLMARNNVHFSIYFGFLAFLQLFFIYRAFKDQRYLYPFLGIVILFGPEFLSWMNGIRQMLAATMFVFAIQFIQKRQLWKYVGTIVLASLFHTSAIVLLVFYFIPQKDYFKHRTLTIGLVIASFLLGNMSFWVEYLTQFSYLLGYLGYDWYSENIELLIDNEEIRNIGPRRLSMILTPLLVIWYSPKLKSTFKNTNFLPYYNIGIFGFLLYNVFANMNHGFIRPITYLTIFIVPITAYLLVYLRRHLSRMYVMFIITLFIALSYTPLSIIADYGKGNLDFSNYQFYWYHINK